jgi:hypothetical protein
VFTSIKAFLENLEVVENEPIPLQQLDDPFKKMAQKFYGYSGSSGCERIAETIRGCTPQSFHTRTKECRWRSRSRPAWMMPR